MSQRVSLNDLARETGLAVSTVSLAVRGKHWVSPETREKVRLAADRLGYRPDPVYSTLGRRAREGRKAAGLGLAVLFDESHPPETRRKFDEILRPLVEDRRCYWNVLEVGPQTRTEEVQRILRTRNISGVIIPRVPVESSTISRLDLAEVSVVAEPGTWVPHYHTLHNDYFDAVYRLCEILYERGRRRIGFALTIKDPPAIDDLRRYGGYSNFVTITHPHLPLLPPWRVKRGQRPRDSFGEWMKKNRPDAVLGFNDTLFYHLQDLGYAVPGEVACAAIYTAARCGRIGGMQTDPELPSLLIDHLIADILGGLRGPRGRARRSLLAMQFVDGDSLG